MSYIDYKGDSVTETYKDMSYINNPFFKWPQELVCNSCGFYLNKKYYKYCPMCGRWLMDRDTEYTWMPPKHIQEYIYCV